jgi:hypothetical protein
MGVGRLTDFYNVRHANDLQLEGHLHYFSFHSLELMLTQFCGFSETDRLGCFNGPYKLPSRLELFWPQGRPLCSAKLS